MPPHLLTKLLWLQTPKPTQQFGPQRDIRERGQMALAKAHIRGPILVPTMPETGMSGASTKPSNPMPPTT